MSAPTSAGDSVLPQEAEKEQIIDATRNQAEPESPKNEASGPPPPPDGGFEAWSQVAGGFCLFFNTWGILNAFGVYQASDEGTHLLVASES